jgi:pimeloyl-ACP methyl ester carboxylesterase
LKFFSGFCVEGESELFSDFIQPKVEAIVGFSYGAIGAFEYAMQRKEFFKKLILLSPAYYAHTSEEFKTQQLSAFKVDPDLYKIKLLKKSGLNEADGQKYGKEGTKDELEKLLYYTWPTEGFEKLKKNGVEIEVFIGANDRVVDPNVSMEFFKQHATVYFIKDKNHFLR